MIYQIVENKNRKSIDVYSVNTLNGEVIVNNNVFSPIFHTSYSLDFMNYLESQDWVISVKKVTKPSSFTVEDMTVLRVKIYMDKVGYLVVSCRKNKVEMYDVMKSDIVRKFINQKDIKPYDINPVKNEVNCSRRTILDKILYFDFECYSHKRASCDPDNILDEIFQISMIWKDESYLLTTKDFDKADDDDFVKIFCEDEEDLIVTFVNKIYESECIILSGHNIYTFDFMYLCKRAELLDIELGFDFNSSVDRTTGFVKYIPKMKGITFFDTLCYAKEYLPNRTSYKLDDIAHDLIDSRKNNFDVQDIYSAFGDSFGKPYECAKYCVQDTRLVKQLNEAKDMVFDVIDKSFIYKASDMVIFQQYGASLSNSIMKENFCWENDILYKRNEYKPKSETDKFNGGYCEATTGYYKNISIADFANLYPAIINTENLDESTFIPDDLIAGYNEDDYNTYNIEEVFSKGKTHITKKYTYYYLKPTAKKGILPTICMGLVTARRAYEAKARLLDKVKDKATIAIYLRRAKNYKISANAQYGTAPQEIRRTTTSCGRNLVKKVIEEVKEYGATSIYTDTDSVFINACEEDGKIIVDKINNNLPVGYLLELEAYYTDMFIFAKKKYVCYCKNSDKYLMKGVSIKRRDTTEIYKNVVKTLLEYTFNDSPRIKYDMYLQNIVDTIKDHPIESYTKNTSLRNSSDDYKNGTDFRCLLIKQAEDNGISKTRYDYLNVIQHTKSPCSKLLVEVFKKNPDNNFIDYNLIITSFKAEVNFIMKSLFGVNKYIETQLDNIPPKLSISFIKKHFNLPRDKLTTSQLNDYILKYLISQT